MTQCERDYIEDSLIEIAHLAMDHSKSDGDVESLREALVSVEMEIREFAFDVHGSTLPIECGACIYQTVCKGARPDYTKADWHHVGYKFKSRREEA